MIIAFLNNINKFILNPLIVLLFAIALLVFFVGIVQFINTETADSKREQGKKKILWGIFGMFIMISAYGLIRLVLGTIGLHTQGYPF